LGRGSVRVQRRKGKLMTLEEERNKPDSYGKRGILYERGTLVFQG